MYVNVCVFAFVCVSCAFSLDFIFPVHLFVLSCSGLLFLSYLFHFILFLCILDVCFLTRQRKDVDER